MRYILIILLSLFSFCGYAQLPTGFPTQANTGWTQWGYQQSTLGTIVATRDTSWTPRFCGTMVLWPNPGIDTAYWMWNCINWKKISTASDIVTPVWGSITGTLSNQTDLQNALNLKLNISDTTNKWVQDVYVRSDSLFKFKNGIETLIDDFPQVTADNGLIKTGSNIQLGGPLIQNTTIDAGSLYNLAITASGSGTPFRVTNTGSGNGVFINTFSGTGSALSAQSNNANVISAFAFGSGYGASLVSTSNIGMYASTTSGVAGVAVDVNPSSTNTAQTVLQLKRYTSGTAANNISGRIEFITEPSAGTVDVTSGYVESGWEDATFATRKSFMALHTTFNGSTTRKINISSSGQQTWDGYPALTAQVDTTTYKPVAINMTTGEVVPFGGWVGDGGGSITGSGAANQITYWTGASTVAGDNGGLFNPTSNTITTDSIFLNKKLFFTGNSNTPHSLTAIQFGDRWNTFYTDTTTGATTGIMWKAYPFSSCDTCRFAQPFYGGIGSAVQGLGLPIDVSLNYGGFGDGSFEKAMCYLQLEQTFGAQTEFYLEFKPENSGYRPRPFAYNINKSNGSIQGLHIEDQSTWFVGYPDPMQIGSMGYNSIAWTPYVNNLGGTGTVSLQILDSISIGTMRGGLLMTTQKSGSIYDANYTLAGDEVTFTSPHGINFISSAVGTNSNVNYSFTGNNSGELFQINNASQNVLRVFNNGNINRVVNITGASTFYNENTGTGSGDHTAFRLLTQPGGGNPYIQFYIQGEAKAWWAGIDNADADKFKMTWDGSSFPGTGTFFTADQDGRIGLKTTAPIYTLHVNGSMGANKDSVSLLTTNGTRQMLVIDTANGKFHRMDITANNIVGTATNNNAVAGNIGEEFNSTVSTYTNYSTTATYQNIASITLTAGDWDLSAFFTYSSNSATITAASNAIFVISTTTASAAGATEGKNIAYLPQAALLGTSLFSDAIAPYRVSISGTTTYYLNSQATFTLGNPQYVGGLRARRVR